MHVLVWTAITHFYAGRDTLAQEGFRSALTLDSALIVYGLQQASPRLVELFEAARADARGARAGTAVHTTNSVDVQPRLTGGPAVVYPWDVWRRRVRGRAVINAIVDALSPLGVRDIEMPATPERVWRAVQSAKARK